MPLPHVPTSSIDRCGAARLLRIDLGVPNPDGSPLLVLPSPVARWRHLDPRNGPSLLRSLAGAGIPTYCLDWGEPVALDRDLTWDQLVDRVRWARQVVANERHAAGVAHLGFSLGGTLAVISTALHPREVLTLVDLSGPVDFSKAGWFVWASDSRWFDPAWPAALYRLTPPALLRATLRTHRAGPMRPWLELFGTSIEAASPPIHELCEAWAQEHVPIPPRAFETYVRDLIQNNDLIAGRHEVSGRTVDLGCIACPVLAVGARRDVICHHRAVTALVDVCGSRDTTRMVVPGGHLGAMVGRRADRTLHDPVIRWLLPRLSGTVAEPCDASAAAS